MNELTNEEQANIELRHIQLELQSGHTQHFRSFVDQYYCYKNGHIRKKSKRAHWEDIVWTGIVSAEAIKLRKKSQKEELTDQAIRKMVVKEHVGNSEDIHVLKW